MLLIGLDQGSPAAEQRTSGAKAQPDCGGL